MKTNPIDRNTRFSPSLRRLAAALALLPPPLLAGAQEDAALDTLVVIAAPMSEPLTVVTDPRAARQPIPAQDGADILKTIPGFSVIRKGGTDGDPVFRGMAGSRLNILLDGEHILGGCGGRMDPPTAYVFPDAYDRVTVLKGPQTVLYGPGNSAGTVLFERDRGRAETAGARFVGSGTFGSFGRRDGVADVGYGSPDFYLRGIATHTRADDYKDGDGNPVHSEYERWSGTATLGWTPDAHTFLELALARSDGEAAYADRSMDGVAFDRENIGLRFGRREISPLVEKLEAQAYRNYIDHVMDNFSLRTPPMTRMLSNPDRLTVGARVAATLRVADATRLDVGADIQRNEHTLRTGLDYAGKPRVDDAEFRNHGLFGEVRQLLGDRDRVIAGLRVDRWWAKDMRASGTWATGGKTRRDTLESGFARWEHELAAVPGTFYAGVGHVQRFPDYWELLSQNKQSMTTNSAFLTRPEKTTQLDLGLQYAAGALNGSLSAFVAHIDDFILVDTVSKGGGVIAVRNVDARTRGLEAGIDYAFAPNWTVNAAVAWVRGENRSDGGALAQMPPLEGRFGLNRDDGRWSAGLLLRLVAAQNRVDPGKGNIAGQDIGKTPGFGVFSINGGYRVDRRLQFAAGVDNLFDKTYAEHLSRAGTAIGGYEQTLRVNEPGRTVWAKATVALD